MTTSTIEDEIRDTDDAFLSAVTPKTVNGQELEPFSLMRQTVAMEIVGQDASAFFDAVVRVWLCTLKPREVVKARLDKEQASITAFDWAESVGYSFENWQPLLDLYKQINDEIRQSTNAVNDKHGEPSPNSGGQPES
jgi:hypothetical protein